MADYGVLFPAICIDSLGQERVSNDLDALARRIVTESHVVVFAGPVVVVLERTARLTLLEWIVDG